MPRLSPWLLPAAAAAALALLLKPLFLLARLLRLLLHVWSRCRLGPLAPPRAPLVLSLGKGR